MASTKTFAALGVAVVLLLLGFALVRNALVGAVQTFTPGALVRDPVVTQSQRAASPSAQGPVNSGWLYLGEALDRLESVEIAEGASLQRVLVAPESSFFRGGSPGRHLMRVSIARQQEYIDGFTVAVNGRTHELSRAPTTWLGRLLGADQEEHEPVGRRMWSNRWFPVAEMAPLGPGAAMPRTPEGTVPLRKGEMYVTRKRPLPYALGNREVVCWSADDPGSVWVTSMDLTEPVNRPKGQNE